MLSVSFYIFTQHLKDPLKILNVAEFYIGVGDHREKEAVFLKTVCEQETPSSKYFGSLGVRWEKTMPCKHL